MTLLVVIIIIPLKKGIMFFTSPLSLSICLSVCLSVCLCVCHQVCDQMAGLINTAVSEAITLDNSSTWQHYQDNPFPFHMGHPDKITFWAIVSKLMNGFTPNLNSM